MSVPTPQEPPIREGRSEGEVLFKDKLVGTKRLALQRKQVDLLKEKLARVEFERGDCLYLKFYLDSIVLKELCVPYQEAPMVKLLGKVVGFLTRRDKLKIVWKPNSGFDILDLGFFFIIKFDLEDDRSKVVEVGPWLLFDHYPSVRDEISFPHQPRSIKSWCRSSFQV